MELDDIAEVVSDLLAKKKELRPLGKKLIEELPEEKRKKLSEVLTEMALDTMGEEYEVGVLAPDTKVTIPPEVVSKNPLTVDDLMELEWSHDWAQAMYRMATGEEPTEEDLRRIIKQKLLPEVT